MRKIRMVEKNNYLRELCNKVYGRKKICVDIKQVHTTELLRCNAQNARKRLREQTI